MSLRPLTLGPGANFRSAGICTECLSRLLQSPASNGRRTFIATAPLQNKTSHSSAFPRVLRKGFFLSHYPSADSVLNKKMPRWLPQRSASSARTVSMFDSSAPTIPGRPSIAATDGGVAAELPHRRRQRLKREKESNSAEQDRIRPDASARLSTLSSSLPKTSLKRKLATYLALTKPQLSFLIVLTATTAYGLYPIPSVLALDPSVTPLPTLSTSTLTFLYLTVGTFLSSACANTLNMLFEPKYDAMMSRTRNRPLVRKLVTRRAAILFAIATGASGVTALYFGTNPTVAALSAFNIFLYAFVYTPLKRISVINTWVGAVVGGIPPLMGWAAAAGKIATTGHDTWRDLLFGPESPGGWLLAAILFAWQFPHFNSLSHTIREEYKNAGYRMLSWVNPARNGRVALRYSILMFPLCAGLWWTGYVTDGFLVGGTLVNAWLTREAYRFWRLEGAKGTSRGLFWASVWHLPLLLVGTMVFKTGIWDGVWSRIFGTPEDEEDEFEYVEEDEEFEASKRDISTQESH
ncbi:hypothetical protein VTO42DRAFT_4969 [Malbranchea cinnamomea]